MFGDRADGDELTTVLMDRRVHTETPESVICRGIRLPEPLKRRDEDLHLRIKAVYTEILNPLPETVRQNEGQKMMYRDNLYVLLPYTVQSQTTTVWQWHRARFDSSIE